MARPRKYTEDKKPFSISLSDNEKLLVKGKYETVQAFIEDALNKLIKGDGYVGNNKANSRRAH